MFNEGGSSSYCNDRIRCSLPADRKLHANNRGQHRVEHLQKTLLVGTIPILRKDLEN